MEKQKLRVALYCRVAQEDQLAIDQQKERLRCFAAEQGYGDPASYLDNGASGLCFDRPALSQLEADIRAGQFDAVIVHDISRIRRDYFKTDKWMEWLERQGVRLVTAGQPVDAEPMNVIHEAVEGYLRWKKTKRKSSR